MGVAEELAKSQLRKDISGMLQQTGLPAFMGRLQDAYSRNVEQGLGLMQQSDPSLTSAGMRGLGLLQYLTAPLNAPFEALGGQVRQAGQSIGLPQQISEGLAQGAEIGVPGIEDVFRSAIAKAGMPIAIGAVRTPKRMSLDDFKNWDFPVPGGGASKTPKTVLGWNKNDYETIVDVIKSGDDFRIKNNLGPHVNRMKRAIEKNEKITVYRAIPIDEDIDIIPGSYVTESISYARNHGEGILKGQMKKDFKVQKLDVYPDELMTFDDPHEFIYIPRSAEIGYERAIKQGAIKKK
jgi:hypothetical protein